MVELYQKLSILVVIFDFFDQIRRFSIKFDNFQDFVCPETITTKPDLLKLVAFDFVQTIFLLKWQQGGDTMRFDQYYVFSHFLRLICTNKA